MLVIHRHCRLRTRTFFQKDHTRRDELSLHEVKIQRLVVHHHRFDEFVRRVLRFVLEFGLDVGRRHLFIHLPRLLGLVLQKDGQEFGFVRGENDFRDLISILTAKNDATSAVGGFAAFDFPNIGIRVMPREIHIFSNQGFAAS